MGWNDTILLSNAIFFTMKVEEIQATKVEGNEKEEKRKPSVGAERMEGKKVENTEKEKGGKKKGGQI